MSILSRVREKFKTPVSGTSRTSKSPSAGSAGSSHRDSETRGTPSAGSAGLLPKHSEALEAEVDVFLSAVQESARDDVLSQLALNPAVQRAFVNRFERDGTMIVTLAIRGVGTGELKIPADRFNQDTLDDYGALLKTISGRHA
jgi:hypothetical protein